MNNKEIIKKKITEYVDLPLLPVNQDINLANIIVYNWDTSNRRPYNGIKYSKLHELKPDDYPLGEGYHNPDDYVTPVKLVDTDKNFYRTLPIQWYVLVDIHDGIHMRESFYSQKTFPHKMRIDEDNTNSETKKLTNKWITDLLNIVGANIMGFLPPQMKDD